MTELTAIGITRLKSYSRNNYLPIYADSVSNTTFVGVNVNTVRTTPAEMSQKYSLDVKYSFRPDLLSYKYYRTPLLGWYICTVNNIVDPFDPETGLYPGRQVIIPSLDYVFEQVI